MIILPAHNPSDWTGPTGNNTYLLPGAVPSLIDAGVGHADHIEAIARALAGAPLGLLLITHGHKDHISGLPAIVARWPQVRILAAPELVLRQPHDMPSLSKHADIAAQTALREGDDILAGDTRLRALHTPGHSPDHFCFFDASAGDLYCGDLARANGTIVIPASHGGHLGSYLVSLHRVRDLCPRRLLPGHGPIIDEPAALIDHYLRHRMQREAQVIEALRAGWRTPEEIVPRVYGALPAGLASAAADSVLAHLIKLKEEGRLHEEGGRWQL